MLEKTAGLENLTDKGKPGRKPGTQSQGSKGREAYDSLVAEKDDQ